MQDSPPVRRVVIVHFKGFDISAAGAFGKVECIFKEFAPNGYRPEQVISYIKEKMTGFGSDDYLVLAGNLTASALAFAYALHKNGCVRILLYDALNNTYVPRLVSEEQFI